MLDNGGRSKLAEFFEKLPGPGEKDPVSQPRQGITVLPGVPTAGDIESRPSGTRSFPDEGEILVGDPWGGVVISPPAADRPGDCCAQSVRIVWAAEDRHAVEGVAGDFVRGNDFIHGRFRDELIGNWDGRG